MGDRQNLAEDTQLAQISMGLAKAGETDRLTHKQVRLNRWSARDGSTGSWGQPAIVECNTACTQHPCPRIFSDSINDSLVFYKVSMKYYFRRLEPSLPEWEKQRLVVVAAVHIAD